MTKYFFLAEANDRIGAGHLMRCKTIAEALYEALPAREEAVSFTAPSALSAQARQDDLFVPDDNALSLFFDKDHLTREQRVIVVDSYQVSDAFLTALRSFGRVLYLDDDGLRPYPVDDVLNYHFYTEESDYRALYDGSNTRFHLGAQYAPVRKQFAEKPFVVNDRASSLLLLSGGADPDNAAGALYLQLRKVLPASLQINLVCGAFNHHAKALCALAAKDPALTIYQNVTDMASLMRENDIALTAGGSTMYELCATGLPFVCYALAKNQVPSGLAAEKQNMAPYAGAYHLAADETCERAASLCASLLEDADRRRVMSERIRSMIDAQGAMRIAKDILL